MYIIVMENLSFLIDLLSGAEDALFAVMARHGTAQHSTAGRDPDVGFDGLLRDRSDRILNSQDAGGGDPALSC